LNAKETADDLLRTKHIEASGRQTLLWRWKVTYWTVEETQRLLKVAYAANREHHLIILLSVTFGLRVSEILAIEGRDIQDGQLDVQRLKRSRRTLQPIFISSDPLFNCSPLIERAKQNPGRLFDYTRQWVAKLVKKYGEQAGLHPSKCHIHAGKHTCAMMIWGQSRSLGELQNVLGHVSAASSLIYLREVDMQKGIVARDAAMTALEVQL
jgi:integrase